MRPSPPSRFLAVSCLVGSLTFGVHCTRPKVSVSPAVDAPAAPAPPAQPPDLVRTDAPAPASSCPGLEKAGGRTYYVCDCGAGATPECRPGDDGASGRKPTSPFKTYQRARTQFAALAAGDTISFCRGGSFPIDPKADQRWVNDRCRAGQPCVVRDYQPPWGGPHEPNPILAAPENTGVFSFDNGGPSRHEEGYTFANLDLEGSGSGWAFFIFNDIDDVNICNLTINKFEIAVHVADANERGPGSDGQNDRISLRSSLITNNGGQGWLGASVGSTIEGCTFKNNGFAKAIFNHNIYLSGHAPADGMKVVGNHLYQSTIVDGRCQGTSLVVHGKLNHLLIEDNTIVEDVGAAADTCWGIGVVSGYKDAESFNDVTISRNRITNVGNVSIALNACQSCTVENNVIVNEQNLNDAAIQIPAIEPGKDDAADDRLLIRNNSIYIDGGTGITLGKSGSGHAVLSNAIYSRGRKPTRCLDLDLPPTSYDAVDYNVCFLKEGGDWAARRGSLSSWSGETLFDRHSAAVDPGFVSIAAPRYDLAPVSGSPLVNRGDPKRSAAVDVTGKTRTDGAPDVGAIER